MRILSVKELEAVIAHEFGHFGGGGHEARSSADRLRSRGAWILGVILASALNAHGWTSLPSTTSMPFPFPKETRTIDPFPFAGIRGSSRIV